MRPDDDTDDPTGPVIFVLIVLLILVSVHGCVRGSQAAHDPPHPTLMFQQNY